MRFAKVNEEVLKRSNEVTGSEFRLYLLILFEIRNNEHIRCNLAHLCGTYALPYNSTSLHLKSLRVKGWLADSKTIKPNI
jgi:hypothetical protein